LKSLFASPARRHGASRARYSRQRAIRHIFAGTVPPSIAALGVVQKIEFAVSAT
jgi:hypothetical protein